jgi:hypothetical protein
MATERLPSVEAADFEEFPDPLFQALASERDRCSDELGPPPPCSKITNLSSRCDRCPVKAKCERLWNVVRNANYGYRLNLKQYRQFSQKFYMLKLERDGLLAKSGLPAHKP